MRAINWYLDYSIQNYDGVGRVWMKLVFIQKWRIIKIVNHLMS
jgi:hypothetical protein